MNKALTCEADSPCPNSIIRSGSYVEQQIYPSSELPSTSSFPDCNQTTQNSGFGTGALVIPGSLDRNVTELDTVFTPSWQRPQGQTLKSKLDGLKREMICADWDQFNQLTSYLIPKGQQYKGPVPKAPKGETPTYLLSTPDGIRVYFYQDSKTNNIHVTYFLSGKYWELLPSYRAYAIIKTLDRDFPGRTLEIHPALDVINPSFTRDDIWNACQVGNFTGCRNQPELKINSDGSEWCVWFGSMESPRHTRIYDKTSDLKSDVPVFRFEPHMRKDYAQQCFNQFVNASDVNEYNRLIAAAALSHVHFIDRTSGDKPSRCDNLPWFQSLLDQAGEVELTMTRAEPSIEDTIRWVERQVTGPMARIREHMGDYRYESWKKFIGI